MRGTGTFFLVGIHAQHKRREDYTAREQKRRSFPDDLYPPKTDRNEERREAQTRGSAKKGGKQNIGRTEKIKRIKLVEYSAFL